MNIVLSVVTYSVVFSVVCTLHWMYLQVRAVSAQFFCENSSCHGLNGSGLNGELITTPWILSDSLGG